MIKNHTTEVKCLHCPSCAGNMEESMLAIDGIEDIKLNYATGMMNVSYDHDKLSLDEIKAILDKHGCEILEAEIEEEKIVSLQNREFVFALISGIALAAGLAVLFITNELVLFKFYNEFTFAEIFFTVAIIFGGYHVSKRAVKGLLNKRFVIDSLMIIGAMGAVFIDAFAEAAAVLFLFSIAELLEDYSVERSRNSLRELIDISPKTAWVKRNGQFVQISVNSIRVNDIIKVKPGERIGADGIIIKGRSNVNQAPITGEPMPVHKKPGDTVFSGTINEEGMLLVKASKAAKDSTLAKIISLVEAAESQKSPTERFIDRFAKYYTPAVVALAVLVVAVPVLVFNQPFDVWFYKALLLLLISCPCALALSTPVAIASGITNGAKNGVLFKGGVQLEKLAEIDTFAFDKTGTLTSGRPQVADIISGNPAPRKQILSITASLESHSEHPIGKAIVEYAKAEKIEIRNVEDFKAIPGKGIKGKIEGRTYYAGSRRLFDAATLKDWEKSISRIVSEGKTLVIVGTKNKIMGILGIEDKIRGGTKDMIASLHRQGIKRTVMVTGDNIRTAKAVAGKIGIDEYHAELLPDQKIAMVKNLSTRNRQVAMVGDGINDAPALAGADI
ncbi:MAG: cadmium-translocating P-type ATPase, partial [Thermoplasmata archaeon]